MVNKDYRSDYEAYYEFLDALRDSGITNMYGAVPYLIEEFEYLAQDEARDILISWMKTYSYRHKK